MYYLDNYTFFARNAGERKKNKKHFLRQSEIESLKSASNRLSLDQNSILCSDVVG